MHCRCNICSKLTTRLSLGMSLVRFSSKNTVQFGYYSYLLLITISEPNRVFWTELIPNQIKVFFSKIELKPNWKKSIPHNPTSYHMAEPCTQGPEMLQPQTDRGNCYGSELRTLGCMTQCYRTLVLNRQTFPVQCSTCSWRVNSPL